MPVSRRSFLIGAGTILTASFLKEAYAFTRDTNHPLLLVPEKTENLIYYEEVEDHWRLHLGKPCFEIPEPQLLIENCRYHGSLLDTQEQIDAFCEETGWSEEQLFSPMNGWDWETQWEHNLSPEAQAFEFLSKHDLFPRGQNSRREGKVIFEEFPNPMSSARWVEVHDPLSISLLQGRLNELSLNIEVKEWI